MRFNLAKVLRKRWTVIVFIVLLIFLFVREKSALKRAKNGTVAITSSITYGGNGARYTRYLFVFEGDTIWGRHPWIEGKANPDGHKYLVKFDSSDLDVHALVLGKGVGSYKLGDCLDSLIKE